MQMMTRDASDASVKTSLAELQRLEEQRQRQVQLERPRAQQAPARDQRETEAARVSAGIETTRQRERQAAEARLLAEEHARTEAELARIETEAKAELEAANARRAHELEMLRVRTQEGHRRVLVVLASALAATLALGVAGASSMARKNTRLEQDLASVTREKDLLLKQSNESRSSLIEALDRRFEALRVKPLALELGAALDEVKRARGAVDDRLAQGTGPATLLDSARISAFVRGLDHVERKLDARERRATLDQRFADLAALSAHLRGAAGAAYAEARRQQALGSSSRRDLDAYERALDRLRNSLGGAGGPARRTSTRSGASQNSNARLAGVRCKEGDPVCGMDGQPL